MVVIRGTAESIDSVALLCSLSLYLDLHVIFVMCWCKPVSATARDGVCLISPYRRDCRILCWRYVWDLYTVVAPFRPQGCKNRPDLSQAGFHTRWPNSARRCASAVLAVTLCLYIRLSAHHTTVLYRITCMDRAHFW